MCMLQGHESLFVLITMLPVIDVCDPNPCVSSAQCIRLAVGYTCACDPPGQISNTVGK
jgi:hypothetical protein